MESETKPIGKRITRKEALEMARAVQSKAEQERLAFFAAELIEEDVKDASAVAPKPKIVVTICGGLIMSIKSNTEVEAIVVNYDLRGSGDTSKALPSEIKDKISELQACPYCVYIPFSKKNLDFIEQKK